MRLSRGSQRLQSYPPAAILFVVFIGVVDLLVWNGDRELVTGQLLPIWVVPTATAIMCTLLLLRYRHPLAIMAVQWSYSLGSNLLVPDYYPFAGLLAALHSVAAKCRPNTSKLALVSGAIPLCLFSYRSAQESADEPNLAFLQAAAVWTVAAGVVWGLGRLSYAAEKNARETQGRLAREAELSVEAERRRLARELHDSVTGAVTAMIMHAAGARIHIGSAETKALDSLKIVEETGTYAMTELHRLLGLLRTSEGAPPGSHTASLSHLDDLVHAYRSSGIDIRVEVTGNARTLDPGVDLAAYRIVQESLTNVLKHAGPGAIAAVRLHWRANYLNLEVYSTSPACPPPATSLSSGFGLPGLRERAHLIGGRLVAGPAEDGWLVHAELPTSNWPHETPNSQGD